MKVLLVSNRLPVAITRDEQYNYTFRPVSGGLVSSLSEFSKTRDVLWIGWLGAEVTAYELPALKMRLAQEFNAIPINLKTDLAERYYNGTSSTVIPAILMLFSDIF
jgi:trehalose 6-phosphate synthase